ncbi:hypothetical protein O181_029839 [Austropuccinia psidii MF-1]|uniref:Chromo domain-containing protein n=1 Tax=Austropuccinia psidii MF-1 TaxID=1389203 RepID=A0A9Q3CRN3_9BASI|nr:hypothetical protein [Austropuccinia psidii MF-1]
MEFSSPCIPCVLIRTSQAINYPKPTSISTTSILSGGERGMVSGSGSALKNKKGKLWYIVEWKGFSEDPEGKAWEPSYNLINSPDLVKNFHTLYPDKPSPNTSRV